MEVLQPLPEEGTAPPRVPESNIGDSSARAPAEKLGKPEPAEDVMLRLSLPQQPAHPPRNPSSFSRPHLRSRSLAGISEALPPMTRAHSSPGLDSRGQLFTNGDAIVDNATKRYPPLQLSPGGNLDARMVALNISGTISEHAEPDSNSSASSHSGSHSPSPVLLPHGSPRISRLRPSSPPQFSSTPTSATSRRAGSPPPSTFSPPMILPRYNESYPPSASSMPSTPTSVRSRSPSISSLETIPDIPDAEDAALESDHIAALKATADKADEAEATSSGTRRRGASDVLSVPRAGSAGYVRADKRKRWSVCGAERRQDLDLETIWED